MPSDAKRVNLNHVIQEREWTRMNSPQRISPQRLTFETNSFERMLEAG